MAKKKTLTTIQPNGKELAEAVQDWAVKRGLIVPEIKNAARVVTDVKHVSNDFDDRYDTHEVTVSLHVKE